MAPAAAPRRSPLVLIGGALAALALVSGFSALGVWQLQRLAWKRDLIAKVDSRIHAAPAQVPTPAEWARITEGRDAYRNVSVTGRFRHDRETLVQAVTARGGGFWVMTPLTSDAGFTLLINRGFVPQERRAPASRAAGSPPGAVRITGLMRMSEPGGGFLRANDPAAGRWYSRDIAAIAKARGLGGVAPFFIDADATPNPGGFPIGGLTVVSFPNSHLGYAITWFALAAMVAGAAGFVARYELRQRGMPR